MSGSAVHAGAGKGRAGEGRAPVDPGARPSLFSGDDAAVICMARMRNIATRSDRDPAIWRRLSQASRRSWCMLARVDFICSASPWDRLGEIDRQKLALTLTMALDFFARAGRDSMEGRPS